MASATRSRACSSPTASPASMDLMQQAKHFIEKAAQVVKLKMKGELDLIAEKQIALRENVWMTTDGSADRLIAFVNNIDHVERSRATNHYKLEITERFANDVGTLLHDVNQLMKTRNKMETAVDLRFTKIADQLRRVEAHMATVPGNV